MTWSRRRRRLGSTVAEASLVTVQWELVSRLSPGKAMTMVMALAARRRWRQGEGHGYGGGGVVAMAIEQGGGGAQQQLIYAVVGTISAEENCPLAKNSRIPNKNYYLRIQVINSDSMLLTPIPCY
jgi:hypothetical protein